MLTSCCCCRRSVRTNQQRQPTSHLSYSPHHPTITSESVHSVFVRVRRPVQRLLFRCRCGRSGDWPPPGDRQPINLDTSYTHARTRSSPVNTQTELAVSPHMNARIYVWSVLNWQWILVRCTQRWKDGRMLTGWCC